MMFRGKEKIAIGMAQPLALPGSFRHGGESIGTITEKLLEEVAVYDRYGYDGVILQNFNDIPVLEASSIEAVAYMTHLAGAIRREFPDQILGVLMIWDGCASLAVAEAAGRILAADHTPQAHVDVSLRIKKRLFLQFCHGTAPPYDAQLSQSSTSRDLLRM